MSIARRLVKLEALEAERAARPVGEPWWERVPDPVLGYLMAQEPAIAAAFGAHLDAMMALPGNKDGFAYYQVLTRPWRPGARRFVHPALTVWDLIFRRDGRITLGEAQVRVLACGFHNLRDALAESAATPPRPPRSAEAVATREALDAAAWARLAGGPLCAWPRCLCFVDSWFPCGDAREPVAAWRERGATDPDSLTALGFGEPELALLRLEDAATRHGERGGDDAA